MSYRIYNQYKIINYSITEYIWYIIMMAHICYIYNYTYIILMIVCFYFQAYIGISCLLSKILFYPKFVAIPMDRHTLNWVFIFFIFFNQQYGKINIQSLFKYRARSYYQSVWSNIIFTFHTYYQHIYHILLSCVSNLFWHWCILL